MTRQPRRGAALAMALMLGAAAAAEAHESVKAIIIMKPGQPRAGESCAFEVSVLAPPGLPVIDQIEGVRIVASMSGHNMTPVEAALAKTADPGGYQGSMALTMGGPWQLTLRIKVSNEEMWADFPVQAVGPKEAGDPVGMRYVVTMRDPVRANLFSPWWVVGVTLGLIVLIEITAILVSAGRSRRAAPAGAA